MGAIQADRLIAASVSWDDLWRRLTTWKCMNAVDAKTKGDVFERLTQLYLLTMPEYRSKLSHVWRVDEGG